MYILCFFLANSQTTRECTNVHGIFYYCTYMSFIIIIMPLILPIYLVITNLKNIKTQPNEHAYIHKSQKIYPRQDALTLPFVKYTGAKMMYSYY